MGGDLFMFLIIIISALLYKTFKFLILYFEKLNTERKNIQLGMFLLEEEIFLLKHDIEVDLVNEKIFYSFVDALENSVYHVEIEYSQWCEINSNLLEDFYTEEVRVKIFSENKVVKEIEIHKPFLSISEIYHYLALEVKSTDKTPQNDA